MKRYRQTIIAHVECLMSFGQTTCPVAIPIACETRRVRIGSAIAATLLADPYFDYFKSEIVGFKITIGSLVIGVDSMGSFVQGFHGLTREMPSLVA